MRKTKSLIWIKVLCSYVARHWQPNATPSWFIIWKPAGTYFLNVHWEMFHGHICWSRNILMALLSFAWRAALSIAFEKISPYLMTTGCNWIQPPAEVTAPLTEYQSTRPGWDAQYQVLYSKVTSSPRERLMQMVHQCSGESNQSCRKVAAK